MNNQITILLSHPNISNSMFNKHLVDINRKNPNFVFHHLDKIPIYWYNSPSSLRDWQDQIMSPIVYSADNFLKGMPVRVVFTAGAAAEHYSHEGLNRYTAEEMLIPFEMTANAAGMKWFKPLGFYGCSPDMTKAALEKAAKEYEESLLELF